MSAAEAGIRRWGERAARRLSSRGFEWAVSLLCLGFVVLWFAGEPLPWRVVSHAGAAALALAVLAFGASLCVAAERWHYLLKGQLPGSARLTAYRSLGLAEVANSLLPMRAGDVVRIGVVADRDRVGLGTPTGVLILERGLGIGSQLLVLGISASLVLTRFPVRLEGTWAVLAASTAAASGVVVAGMGAVALSRWASGRSGNRALGALLAPFASLTAGAAVVGTALSVGALCAEGAAWWAASQASGLGLSPLEATYVLALSTLALVIPAGPGAIGTLDAAVVLVLGGLGPAGAVGLGFIFGLRLAMLLACLGFWAATVATGRMRARGSRPDLRRLGSVQAGGGVGP